MKNLNLLITILFISICLSGFSQNEKRGNWCGTQFTEEIMERVQASTEKYEQGSLVRSRMEYNIPLTVHNMRNTDGSGGADVFAFIDFMCEVTEFYAEFGVNLYIDEIINHDNTNWTLHNQLGTITFLNDVNNTLNIYMFKTLPPPASQPNGILCGYYSPYYDVLALNSSACFNAATTIHEIGHFFSLPHTFFGLEGTGNNCGVYVTEGEKVDGSNCAIEGDRICDTPPDNNALGGLNCPGGTGCQQYDIDSVAFNPDPTNYMSYFDDSCLDKFTAGQKAVVTDHIETSRQGFLPDTPPNLNPVTEITQLNSPLQDEEKPYDQVGFAWSTVENADIYYFEINRLGNFSPSFIIESRFLSTNQYTSTELSANTLYHWRIIPYNGAAPCPGTEVSSSFKTTDQSVDIEDVTGLESFEVSPNPASNQQSITVTLQSNKSMFGTLNLYNVSGQLLHHQTINVLASDNLYALNVQDLATGLYVVQLDFEEGSVQQKLIITQ